MSIGFSGSPTRGYDVEELLKTTVAILEACEGQRVALVGIGNLGHALLAFAPGRVPGLTITAAFDSSPEKVDQVIYGCRAYPVIKLPRIVAEQGIGIGIITVPAAAAQDVADQLVKAGVVGILNFAPIKLRVPAHVHVEHMDVTMALERVAYYACNRNHGNQRRRKDESN